MKNYRIGILGLGGVGGYVGAKLAAADLQAAEINFIARGETKAALQQNGLRLITDNGTLVVHPDLVSDDPVDIKRLDLLIIAVKAYDLKNALEKYQNCLHQDSIVLPMLNGINITDEIGKIIPGRHVWKACIYVVARQTGRGIITQSGPAKQIWIGSDENNYKALAETEVLLKKAGLTADIAPDIDAEIWKKFFFISVLGTVTSYYNGPVSLIQQDPVKKGEILQMITELENVAHAKGVKIDPGLGRATYDRILSLEPGATSSMYADFQRNGPTEADELTGEIVRLGRHYHIDTPVYQRMYEVLKLRKPVR